MQKNYTIFFSSALFFQSLLFSFCAAIVRFKTHCKTPLFIFGMNVNYLLV